MPSRPFPTLALLALCAGLATASSGRAAALVRAELVGHFAAGRQPTAVALVDDGRSLLVTNRGDATVDLFDATTLDRLRHYSTDSVGHGVWDGRVLADGREVLVANWVGESLTLFDRESGEVTGVIPTGIKPSYVALSADGRRAFAAGSLTGDVTLVDLESRKAVRTLEVGQRPMGVACSPDGRFLYVASCASNKITKIDLKYEAILEHFGAPLAETSNLALTPDGLHLLAVGDHGRLLVVDPEGGAVRKIAVGGDLSSVSVSPDGRTAFVSVYDESAVAVVDLVSGNVTDRLATGPGPLSIVTDGQRVWIANDRANSISVYRFAAVVPVRLPPAQRPDGERPVAPAPPSGRR